MATATADANAAAAAAAADIVDVVVIGGGAAGLRAARGLLAAGLSCAVLEARGRVGGRLLSRAGADLGAAWSWPGEHRVAALASELGVARFAQHERGDALLDRGAGAPPARIDGERARVGGLRFAGGAMALADGLAARLPPGTVRLGARVAAVRRWGRGAAAEVEVEVKAEAAHEGEAAAGVGEAAAGVGAADSAAAGAGAGAARRLFSARVAVILALPPALAAAAISFDPALPASVAALASDTPTWMADMAKTVVTYSSPFWRSAGLSGSAFSGEPLSEIFDHSGAGAAGPFALFGFSSGGAPARAAVIAQLERLFGAAAAAPLSVETQDWSREQLTAGAAGSSAAAGSDPRRHYGDRVFSRPVAGGGGGGGSSSDTMPLLLFASTETAAEAAGHIEGALCAADRAVALAVRAAAAAR
jgi:monoamine oxidase